MTSEDEHSLSVAARRARSKELSALAVLFLRLGVTAFGGPAAHIAMMEDEVVRRRRWMTHVRFLDLIGMTNLIPGPNSTEMAIHIGHERAGWRGLVVSGVAFIAPSTFITGGLAWAYVRFGARPQASAVLYGVRRRGAGARQSYAKGSQGGAAESRRLAVLNRRCARRQ